MSKTYISLVLDTSGSIGPIRKQIHEAVNSILLSIRSQAERGSTYVSIVMFDSIIDVVLRPTLVEKVGDLAEYPIRGMTALFDGVAKGIELLDSKDTGEADDAFLVMVFTDGYENASIKYNAAKIKRLMDDRQKTGSWTFAFQLPPGHGKQFSSSFGIPPENIREWEATAAGTKEMGQRTNSAVGNYLTARSAGMTAVKNFYQEVTTDLSKLTSKEVKKELTDVSKDFRVIAVTREESIKTYIEEKTKKPYIIGSVYYELTKSEKVQPSKKVLLQKKGEKTIYGGDEARELIGLPTDGVTHAKVTPGNHSDYRIFIASTSTNRKVIRGTSLLLDKTKKKDDKPTWEDLTKTK